MFTAQDLEYIRRKGLTPQDVESQLRYFSTGFPPLDITGPAVPGNGIVCFDSQQQRDLAKRYDEWNGSRVKFVPASGAATRMFKDLFQARDILAVEGNKALSGPVEGFFSRMSEFAFYPLLAGLKGHDPGDRLKTLTQLLEKEGLGFASLPKGLIPFHKYPDGPRTPFEEHLVEAAHCTAQPDGKVKVHFTVSSEHMEWFVRKLELVRERYEERLGVQFVTGFSTQSPATDTIAADKDNRPFRAGDGSLVFRPGGHGALLDNLNSLEEDMVFIRNIDNVVPEASLAPVIHWRKVLAGYLLYCRRKVYAYISQLKEGADTLLMKEMAGFLEDTFGITHPPMEGDEFRSYLSSKLNRPLRVCGMVRSTGEPGGGPFRVRDRDGCGSLQILEQVQLGGQTFHTTHFNPVDLVCSFRAYDGSVYRLAGFRDDKTGFISHKSMEGRELKALELPGLWNGAMSRWNTAFVEVPLNTFNPVKTVTDLLRKEHNN